MSKYLIQFDVNRLLLQDSLTMKEIGTGVILAQQAPFFIRSHRRQLKHITNENDLYATKRLIIAISYVAQDSIDRIEHIGAYHTYFVDNQQFKLLQHLTTIALHFHLLNQIFASFYGWYKRCERQLKEGVHGSATCIDGSNTCWRNNSHLFFSRFL